MSSAISIAASTSSPSHPSPSHPPSPKHLASLIVASSSSSRLLELQAAALCHGHHLNPIVNSKLQRSYSAAGLPHLHLFTPTPTSSSSPLPSTPSPPPPLLPPRHPPPPLRDAPPLCRPNAFTLSSALKALPRMYAAAGDLPTATAVFAALPFPDVVSCTAMLSCYASTDKLDLEGVGRALRAEQMVKALGATPRRSIRRGGGGRRSGEGGGGGEGEEKDVGIGGEEAEEGDVEVGEAGGGVGALELKIDGRVEVVAMAEGGGVGGEEDGMSMREVRCLGDGG